MQIEATGNIPANGYNPDKLVVNFLQAKGAQKGEHNSDEISEEERVKKEREKEEQEGEEEDLHDIGPGNN